MPGVKKILEIKNGVAVIATNSWYAMKAVDAVDLRVGALGLSRRAGGSLEGLEVLVQARIPRQGVAEDRRYRSRAEGRASLIEAEYRAPYVAHQPLEPLNGIGHRHRQGDGNLGRPSEPPIRAVHRGDGDRHQAGTGHLPQSVDGWKLWPPSRIRERPRSRRDRQPDAAERRSSWCSRAKRIPPGHPAADRDRPVPRQHRKSKIVAADLQLAATAPFKGLLERMGTPSKDPDGQLAAGMWNMYYDIPNFRATSYEAQGLSPAPRGGRSAPRQPASSPKASSTS